MIRSKRVFVLLAAGIFATACASGKSGEAVPQTSQSQQRGDLQINIRNNLIPPTPVYIYLIPGGGGIERDLGQIFGGDRSVRYRGLPLQGSFQLVARGSARQIVSPILVLTKVQEIEWDLERNFIQVTKVADQ